MAEVAFIKTELVPCKKGSQNNIIDIIRCHVFKVNKNFESSKVNIPFFPSELKVVPALNVDQLNNVVWRSLQLEDDLRQTRENLKDVKLIVCYDKLTEIFLKELLKETLEDLIIQVIS